MGWGEQGAAGRRRGGGRTGCAAGWAGWVLAQAEVSSFLLKKRFKSRFKLKPNLFKNIKKLTRIYLVF